MLRYLAFAGLVACGGARPKPAPPPPAPLPLHAEDLRGDWRAADLDGWTYDLQIGGDGFRQVVHRTAGGACTQTGTLQPYEQAYGAPYVPPGQAGDEYAGLAYGGATYGGPATRVALVLTLEQNDCNPDYAYGGAQLIVIASDFDGSHVTLRLASGWGGPEETHRYEQVPAPAPGKKP